MAASHHLASVDEQVLAAREEERHQRAAPREYQPPCTAGRAAISLFADGLARLPSVLEHGTADGLRSHVRRQLSAAAARGEAFGEVLCRRNRTDLPLAVGDPLVRGAIEDALRVVGPCLARSVGRHAVLYECAALVTDPGAPRQQIHPDTPWARSAQAVTTFVALQVNPRQAGAICAVARAAPLWGLLLARGCTSEA